MTRLTGSEITVMLLGLGVLLASARLCGELVRRLNQPAVLGEMLAGIILGPTILGSLMPETMAWLFPRQGSGALVLDGFITLAISLFLLVAGIEVDLSTMWRQGRTAAMIGITGVLVPFGMGYAAATLLPAWFGAAGGSKPHLFALFFATALSISALPVIAKTLMDLALYRSDIGMTVIAAAVFNDLCGWMSFAVILGMMGTSAPHNLGIAATIWTTIGFALFMLTGGRYLINHTLPWLQAHTSWPGGVLAFALSLALFSAAFTEWMGVHAIFGAFIAGVAIGDSPHLREHTRTIIGDFVSFIFAPVFFASIGLTVNFYRAFDPWLTLVVLVIACAGKLAGCGLGARLSGVPSRQSWAIGFAMNARGAMEIILGLLALKYGLIGDTMFVALVIMALLTSMLSGPAIYRILQLKRPRRLSDLLSPRMFVNRLKAGSRDQAIRELVQVTCSAGGVDPLPISQAVLEREQLMSTGIGNGIAIPHARIDGLVRPLIGLGLSDDGIDFNAPDGEPARIMFLILTPRQNDRAQIEVLADIARVFKDAETRRQVVQVGNFTQLLALLRTRNG